MKRSGEAWGCNMRSRCDGTFFVPCRISKGRLQLWSLSDVGLVRPYGCHGTGGGKYKGRKLSEASQDLEKTGSSYACQRSQRKDSKTVTFSRASESEDCYKIGLT